MCKSMDSDGQSYVLVQELSKEEAATIIQAGMKGMLARQSIRTEMLEDQGAAAGEPDKDADAGDAAADDDDDEA